MDASFDLIVIGSGPAGQKAAVAAAKSGRRVLVVERGGEVGGVCVHSGTIPSKALREAVLVLSGLRSRRVNGVRVELDENLGVEDLISHTAGIVATETRVVREQMARNGIALISGEASFASDRSISVTTEAGERLFTANRIIVAVGAEPMRPPVIPFDDERVFDSHTILGLSRLPKRMLIVGAGVIGVEYACIFANLGVSVDVTDRRRELLGFVDRELAAALAERMCGKGVRLRMGEDISGVETAAPALTVALSGGERLETDAILYVQGRVAATATLRLDRVGLAPGKGGQLAVNANYQTAVPHIYAVGDVIGFPSLASTSMEQGRIAACHAFGIEVESFPDLLPFGIYTIPEISMVGRSEEQLRSDGIPFAAGRAHYREIARGHLVGDDDGLLKILFDPETRKLLGVHALGNGATELIHIGQAVIAFGGTIDYFVASVFNYPTFAECYRVAALDGINRLRARSFAPASSAPPDFTKV
jgi:NAD(P) transhydrogenase